MRRTRSLLLLPALLAAAGCATTPPALPDAAVRVRLMWQEQAVPGATATAIEAPGAAFSERQVSAVAGPDGRAVLALPPGAWFVKASSDRPALFGWYGSNPLQVRPGEVAALSIPALPAPGPPRVERVPAGGEEVAGDVVGADGPVAGASVAFYLDAATLFRGPGYLEVETDADGRFVAAVSPGSYWIVARRRAGAAAYGPLEIGDDFGFYAGNPLRVGEGERVEVRVGAVRVLKRSGWSGPSQLRTRVSGTIRDGAGRPLEGYRAFLHANPAMLGKPEYVSEPSGADGSYAIWVDREGTFYLGARAVIGRARDRAEEVGVYRGRPDHAVQVRLGAGEVSGLDVTVAPAD